MSYAAPEITQDYIRCEICGKAKKSLGNHHLRMHGYTPTAYRLEYGYNRNQSLNCLSLQEKKRLKTLNNPASLKNLAKKFSLPSKEIVRIKQPQALLLLRQYNERRKNQITFQCDFCGETKKEKASQYLLNTKHYCSKPCYYASKRKEARNA